MEGFKDETEDGPGGLEHQKEALCRDPLPSPWASLARDTINVHDYCCYPSFIQ